MNAVTSDGRAVEPAAAKTQAFAGKYLTFVLDAEEYAVSVLKVREIIKVMDITSVPQLPSYVKGVINLRGKVIPVVDLRLKFGMAAKPYSERTCIIVVDVAVRSGSAVLMGVVVDSVSDVMNISADELAEPPDFGEAVDGNCVQALAKIKGTVKILLNLDSMLGADEELVRA
jgi:purine-binding chemotaxis protein CheW